MTAHVALLLLSAGMVKDFTAKVIAAAGVLVLEHRFRAPLHIVVVARNGAVASYVVTELTRGGSVNLKPRMTIDAPDPEGSPSPLHIMVVDSRGRGAMCTESTEGAGWAYAIDEAVVPAKKPGSGRSN
jgi:hypothetical protein